MYAADERSRDRRGERAAAPPASARGHPWVFRPDVVRGPKHDAGDGGPSLVRVRDGRGRPLGVATWAARPRLALRMVARAGQPEPADLAALVAERLAAALARRQALNLDRDAYRVAHAESDLLPGLVVDRYADAAVIQTTSVAMSAARDADRGRSCASGWTRASSSAATTGRRATSRSCRGSRASSRAAATRASSTGWAEPAGDRPAARRQDRRLPRPGRQPRRGRGAGAAAARARWTPSRTTAASRWRWRAAAARCWRSTRTRPPPSARAANARRNELANMRVERGNAFDLLRAFEGRGERFDVVVLDPPALAKRGGPQGWSTAARAYKELVLRGARLTRAGRAAGRLLVLGARDARALGRDLRRRDRRRGPDARTSCRAPAPAATTPSWSASPRPRTSRSGRSGCCSVAKRAATRRDDAQPRGHEERDQRRRSAGARRSRS